MERFALAFEDGEATAHRRIAAWEQWLVHDPTDTEETRVEARMRELMEAV